MPAILISLVPVLLKAVAAALDEYHQAQADHTVILARLDAALDAAKGEIANLQSAHAQRVAEMAALGPK